MTKKISITPTAIDFETISLGRSVARTFEIESLGTEAVSGLITMPTGITILNDLGEEVTSLAFTLDAADIRITVDDEERATVDGETRQLIGA